MSTIDALWTLIESQTKSVRKALMKRMIEAETVHENKAMVKERMTRAFDELHTGQAKSDARKLFAE